MVREEKVERKLSEIIKKIIIKVGWCEWFGTLER